MKKTLYLVKTSAYRAYVIASTPNDAWNIFSKWLNRGDGYGFTSDRLLVSIEVIASESAYCPLPQSGCAFDKGYDMLLIEDTDLKE